MNHTDKCNLINFLINGSFALQILSAPKDISFKRNPIDKAKIMSMALKRTIMSFDLAFLCV